MSDINNEILAAISMALYDLQDEVHDVESNVLTIQRPVQDYLPWASKALMLTQRPTRK
ncbi:MAG: hypothetical protein RL662_788 [Bacteroidota bacterium]|jgi:hypothetical protein